MSLENVGGNPLTIGTTSPGVLTVWNVYGPGDVNGDGFVTQDDFVLLVQIVAHRRTPTDDQLAAGDLNGNGVLDHRDAQILKRMLQGKSKNP